MLAIYYQAKQSFVNLLVCGPHVRDFLTSQLLRIVYSLNLTVRASCDLSHVLTS